MKQSGFRLNSQTVAELRDVRLSKIIERACVVSFRVGCVSLPFYRSEITSAPANGPVEFDAFAQEPCHASRVRQHSRHGRYDALILVVAVIEYNAETHCPEALLMSY